MKYLLPLTVFLTLNFSGSSPAQAETEARSATVYRCGKDGRDLRDAPCPDKPGAAGSTVAYDQPGATDAQAARERAAADARQADALQDQRQKTEAEQRRATAKAGRIGPPPAPAAAPARPASPPLVAYKPRLHKPKKPRTNAG